MADMHQLLVDQGNYVHIHFEAEFDDGDPENGPGTWSSPAYDMYSGDSHDIIVQQGLIVDLQVIDWAEYRFFESFLD